VLGAVDVPLEQHEFDAASPGLQHRRRCFRQFTLVKMLNQREAKSRVAEQFLRWDKVNGKPLAGLTRRRKAEREMFLGQA
jgi:lysozyme